MRSGDSLREEQLTLQLEGGGAIPTSPHQFIIKEVPIKAALIYNEKWHSRLPKLTNWFSCNLAYAATFNSEVFAVAIFGRPVARAFNDKPVLELRRMAICDKCPKNTASRVLKVCLLLISRKYPNIEKVISYQDTEVHKGTIYKASNWKIGRVTKAKEVRWGALNKEGKGRKRNRVIAKGDKIRWEYNIIKKEELQTK